MKKNADLVERLRLASELARAVAERDAIRRGGASGGKPEDIAHLLRANHRVRLAALRLIGDPPPL